MENNIKTEIENSKTLRDYMKVLKKHYDLENCKPSTMIKTILVAQIIKLIPKTQTPISIEPVRIKCLQSNNLFEFVSAIENGFTFNSELSPEGKTKLVGATNDICTVTKLKPKITGIPSGQNTEEKSPDKNSISDRAKKLFKRKK